MDKGVDGLITDYPDRLRELMADRGLPLPRAYDAPRRTDVEPLPQAHAHNDYEHTRPLHDALSHGFTSVEADVWLVDGELLVAHDRDGRRPVAHPGVALPRPAGRPGRREGGRVYRGHDGVFQLLIDVKSAAGPTYAAVHEELAEHKRIMTTFRDGPGEAGRRHRGDQRQPRPARDAGPARAVRRLRRPHGRPRTPACPPPTSRSSATTGPSTSPGRASARCPRQSGRSCTTSSTGRTQPATGSASGPRPTSPDPARDAVWDELLDAGVDHLNTDDLAGLHQFLSGR